jgi:hypothetical protein
MPTHRSSRTAGAGRAIQTTTRTGAAVTSARPSETSASQSGAPTNSATPARRLLIAAQRNILEIATQLGHRPEMTLRTYGHLIDEYRGPPPIDIEGRIAGFCAG